MIVSQQVELACRSSDNGAFDTCVARCRELAPDRVEYAVSRSLLASVYRQVGRHDLAQPFDEQGIRPQVPDALGQVMCRCGLAADRVGVGDLAGARSALRRAESAMAELGASHWATRWFDPWITHAWIGAEICLLADEPDRAAAVLRPFVQIKPRQVRNTRWPFERAKTLLFLGVSQRCAGQRAEATASLELSARIAAHAQLAPLLVPAVEQLAVLDPARAQQWTAPVERARSHLQRHTPPGL